jgi:putative membrane protein
MFSTQTRKWLQALLLLLLGLYFLDNMLSGRIYFYINERFGWLSWIGTGIFLVLGIGGVYQLLRERSATDEHGEHDHADHEHEHEHEHGHEGHDHGAAPSWPILGLIAVPLIVGLVVPAKPLGAAAIGTSGVSNAYTSLQGSGNSTQLSVAATDRNVLDWIKAFNTSENVDEFTGQEADVIGLVYRDIRFKDTSQIMVARFIISCCVADASAIGVTVQSADAAKLAQDSWIHVKGKFQVQNIDGQKVPVLMAESIEPTNQPTQPYLYP